MLYIELKINYKTIRTIGVQNVSSIPVNKTLKAECSYDVWDLTDAVNPLADRKYLGEITHFNFDDNIYLSERWGRVRAALTCDGPHTFVN